jgi:hypothetical protein
MANVHAISSSPSFIPMMSPALQGTNGRIADWIGVYLTQKQMMMSEDAKFALGY